MTNITIGQKVKINAKMLDDAGYEDMRRFHAKSGVVVGIGNILPGLLQVQVGNRSALFRPICLEAV